VINTFLGWTLVGWLVALAVAIRRLLGRRNQSQTDRAGASDAQDLRSWRRSTRTVNASFSRRLCLKTSRANRRCRLRLTTSRANATTTATRRGDRTCPRGLRCPGASRSFAGSASTHCILPGLDRREAPDRTRGCGSATLLDRARVVWCPRCSKEEPCGLFLPREPRRRGVCRGCHLSSSRAGFHVAAHLSP
jgi:hypothetical protein